MRINSRKVRIFIACFLIIFSVAFIGSIFTGENTKSAWYESVKPSITPPNYVFPIAWSILFVLIAVSMYFAWLSSDKKEKRNIIVLYGLNFVLNIVWSVLYFALKNALFAFVEIILLWVSILCLVLFTWKVDRKAAYCLIPYLLWVSFAAVLNFLSLR
jgi:benzodiazapine receptor